MCKLAPTNTMINSNKFIYYQLLKFLFQQNHKKNQVFYKEKYITKRFNILFSFAFKN